MFHLLTAGLLSLASADFYLGFIYLIGVAITSTCEYVYTELKRNH